MEITGILTFIGIFLSIVLILISIAYYGIKEPTYDEAVTVNSNETKKKSKKDISNKKQVSKTNSNSSSSSTESKKRTSSGENNKKANNNVQEIPEEEDPIVIIPDPFTMQLSSRFAGATKNGPVTSGQNVKRDTQTQQVAKLPKQQQQQQKHKEDIALENDAKKEIETENLGAFTIKTLEKIKPKATVKPNQNHVLSNSNFSSDFQIKSVAVTGSVPQVQLSSNKMINGDLKASKTLDLVSNGDSVLAMVNVQLKEKIKSMENSEMALNTKLKELSLDLTEKIKQIDALNKANLTCKNEITR